MLHKAKLLALVCCAFYSLLCFCSILSLFKQNQPDVLTLECIQTEGKGDLEILRQKTLGRSRVSWKRPLPDLPVLQIPNKGFSAVYAMNTKSKKLHTQLIRSAA